ncbi:MAG TPA: phosphoribosylamine--glycine ligase [Candidatus Altiarchaeales archaeon]|nr:phosphoribosylamine--glycine ligase [Candidatus Altiarchaeales archaeon]
MKVLVVGNGAREHVIAEALSLSPQKPELYAYMNSVNPGIARLCAEYKIGDILKPGEITRYCLEKDIELAVVGPEAPLDAGVADALVEAKVMCVGPRKAAAKIETDKSFARNLMRKYGIPGCPEFGVFKDPDEAERYIDSAGHDVVIKPSGLTGGKGVKVMGEHFDKAGAKAYAREVLETRMGTIPEVVIEERLFGEEFTLHGLVDGARVVGTPMVQDHKRAYDGDVGPNTGGMGSYTDAGMILPFATKHDYAMGLEIMKKTVDAIKEETGIEYRGFLYGQFMAGKKGVSVVEFNARFGDPEAMNVVPLIDGDFLEICRQMAKEGLRANIAFRKKATVCKYLVPDGYPEKPRKHLPVKVDEKKISEAGGKIYYASVSEEDGKVYTSSSRAIAVVGTADTIWGAEKVAEESLKHIEGELFHRKDIGTKELVQKRIDHMKELRGA